LKKQRFDKFPKYFFFLEFDHSLQKFISLVNECFLVWNYWADQDYQESKEKIMITKIFATHFPHGIETEKGDEFLYFDNNANQFNSPSCYFYKDSENYFPVIFNFSQKFDDFVYSIHQTHSDWEIEYSNFLYLLFSF
jgi:hypothetical protein